MTTITTIVAAAIAAIRTEIQKVPDAYADSLASTVRI